MGYNKGTGATGKFGALNFGGVDLTATATELNRYDLSVQGGVPYIKTISLAAAASTAETDTSYDLPDRALVVDCNVLVTTAASAGATIDVGLLASSSGGDLDGFLDGVSIAATGLKAGTPTATSSAGFSATTRGALLRTFFAGVESSSPGVHNEKRHLSDSVTAKSVTWTINSSGTAFRGVLILNLVEVTS